MHKAQSSTLQAVHRPRCTCPAAGDGELLAGGCCHVSEQSGRGQRGGARQQRSAHVQLDGLLEAPVRGSHQQLALAACHMHVRLAWPVCACCGNRAKCRAGCPGSANHGLLTRWCADCTGLNACSDDWLVSEHTPGSGCMAQQPEGSFVKVHLISRAANMHMQARVA